MDNMELYRQEEMKRLIAWTKTSKTNWMRNMGLSKHPLKMEDHLDILRDLYQSGFYTLLFAHVVRYLHTEPLQEIVLGLLVDRLTQSWDPAAVRHLSEELLDRLEQRCARKQAAADCLCGMGGAE